MIFFYFQHKSQVERSLKVYVTLKSFIQLTEIAISNRKLTIPNFSDKPETVQTEFGGGGRFGKNWRGPIKDSLDVPNQCVSHSVHFIYISRLPNTLTSALDSSRIQSGDVNNKHNSETITFLYTSTTVFWRVKLAKPRIYTIIPT